MSPTKQVEGQERGAVVRPTHPGLVALIGDLADEVERPVDLGFLDDSTVGNRRRAIHRDRGPGPRPLPTPRGDRHREGMTSHETAGSGGPAPEGPATTATRRRSRPAPHDRRPRDPLRPRRPVVAGVDGSPAGYAAVQWAADEALASGRPLHLVHAVTVESGMASPLVTAPLGWYDPEWSLREAERQVRERLPRLRVSTVRVDEGPTQALRDLSLTAALVVVGTSGHTRVGAFVLGSTAAVLAASAGCPVVVVHRAAAADAQQRVVVGVDGSPGSERALRAAADWADRHGRSLTAVHAWPGDVTVETARVPAGVRQEMRAAAQHRQGVDVTGWVRPVRAAHPGLRLGVRVPEGDPAQVLVDLSATARLVVVGSRGRGTLGRLALGSVSTGVLHHAHCPVMVLPPPVEERAEHRADRLSETV